MRVKSYCFGNGCESRINEIKKMHECGGYGDRWPTLFLYLRSLYGIQRVGEGS